MLDAFGKPPAGLFQGNLNWFGSYDECLDLTGETKPSDFDTQYCLASLPVPFMPVSTTL